MTQKTIVSSGSQGNEHIERGGASTGANDLAVEAKQIAGDVKQLAGEAADQAKQFAQDQIATRKERAVGALGEVAEALRASGGRLNSKNGAEAAQYVTRVADGLDRVSGYLKDRDLGDVMHDVEGFARREPAIFLGGAFVLGLVGSRFLKSSRAPQSQAGGSSMPSYRIASSASGSMGSSARRNGDPSNGSTSGESASSPKARPGTGVVSNSASTTGPSASSSTASSAGASSSGPGATRAPSNGPRGGTPGLK